MTTTFGLLLLAIALGVVLVFVEACSAMLDNIRDDEDD